jgi:hypothetical protein
MKSKTWGPPKGKSPKNSTHPRTISSSANSRKWWWWWWRQGYRQRTKNSSAKNTAVAERKRKICEPIASKKRPLKS